MKKTVYLLALASFLFVGSLAADPAPFDGKTFDGRIAYSADGNHNDEDDWAASPVSLAIFDAFGVRDKLVHFDYNSILPKNDPEWEKIHRTSVLGAIERYGYDASRFFDCRRDVDGAIADIASAIDASSADDPLYFIIAGPMEVPYKGIMRADPAKLKFVYVISHSRWNDGFATDYQFTYNKRPLIELGVHWVQISDQNRYWSTSRFGREAKPEEWEPWHWMRDSADPNVRFLWDRMRVTTRADCSDAGMAYFLMTGDEVAEVSKLRDLLEKTSLPQPIAERQTVRVEAENFVTLGQFELDFRNDRTASHRISIKVEGKEATAISTPLRQPALADSARYDIDVRFAAQDSTSSELLLFVNGRATGHSWTAKGTPQEWQSHTISDVLVAKGDSLKVSSNGPVGLDYVELRRR